MYIQGPTGYLGIRTDDPQRNLHSHSTGSGANYIQITNDTTGTAVTQGSLVGIDQNENLVLWTYGTGDKMRFGTEGTERMVLDTSGHMEITDGNLVIGTSGHGIDFSATSDSGGSSSSELFDDYEVGTWTPTITEGTMSVESAVYTKIGRMVNISARLQTFSDRSSSSNISVGGIPFAVQDATNIGTGVYYRVARTDQGHIGTMVTGSDKVQFLVSSQGGSESRFYLQHADLNSSGSQVRFNVWYIT